MTRDSCGTLSGYMKHRRSGENSCRPCKDANAASFREKYAKHPERERARFQRNAQDPAYLAKHREYVRVTKRKRRAQKAKSKFEPYTEAQVLETYGLDCHVCGDPIDLDAPRRVGWGEGWQRGLHFDHVIPLSKGGADTLENVRPAHAYCNLTKSNKLLVVPDEVVPTDDQASAG